MILALSGCIIVPVASKNPYPPELLNQFSKQGADRDLVGQILGNPTLTKSGGKYWFYTNTRDRAWLIGLTATQIQGGSIFPLSEWVMVEFDDAGHVIFYEYNDKDDGCLSNGICMTTFSAVVAAPQAQDMAAKSYKAHSDECAVYVFLEPLPFLAREAPLNIDIDGQPRGTIDHETYLFLTHPSGEISVSANDSNVREKCEGGSRVYVRVERKAITLFKMEISLLPVKAVDGEAAIHTRRLALPD